MEAGFAVKWCLRLCPDPHLLNSIFRAFSRRIASCATKAETFEIRLARPIGRVLLLTGTRYWLMYAFDLILAKLY